MLNPQNLPPGSEQYEEYTTAFGNGGTRVQYDYRACDGELFSCIAKTVEEARKRRDKWLEAKHGRTN